MSIPRNLGNFADNLTSTGTLNVGGINATGTPSSTTVLAGDGSWVTPSAGALVFISSQTVSTAVAQVDFTTGISSTYDDYIFYLEGLKSSATNNELVIRLYKSGAFQTTGYNYQYSEARAGTTASLAGVGNNTGTRIQLNTGNQSATATFQSGQILLFNVNNATANACMTISQFAGMGGTTSENFITQSSGSQNTAAVVTGIRFYYGSGANISSGTFRLYGIAKS